MRPHLVTLELEIIFPEQIKADEEAKRICADISRETGYSFRVVSVLKKPEVEGIKMEGKC